ncbi:MAG: hypothetical protein ABIQ18_12705 [Umezawaea sp.]
MSTGERGENIMNTDGNGSRRAHQNDNKRSTPKLNQRQHDYLELFYQLDQEEQRRQQRRWHQHLHRDHAADWRWIPYAIRQRPAIPTLAQELLAAKGLHDTGAGATLTALFRRGLIDLRHTIADTAQGPLPQTEVRLTTKGRATAKAKRPSPKANARLPEWLHQALLVVAEATSTPPPKTEIGRAAARTLGPKGFGYIEDANAWAYQVTDAGHRYLDASQR